MKQIFVFFFILMMGSAQTQTKKFYLETKAGQGCILWPADEKKDKEIIIQWNWQDVAYIPKDSINWIILDGQKALTSMLQVNLYYVKREMELLKQIDSLKRIVQKLPSSGQFLKYQ